MKSLEGKIRCGNYYLPSSIIASAVEAPSLYQDSVNKHTGAAYVLTPVRVVMTRRGGSLIRFRGSFLSL